MAAQTAEPAFPGSGSALHVDWGSNTSLPAILLPALAERRGAEFEPTLDAVRRACRWLAEELRPDRLHLASPHLGHGFDVPLLFIGKALGVLPPTERLLTVDETTSRIAGWVRNWQRAKRTIPAALRSSPLATVPTAFTLTALTAFTQQVQLSTQRSEPR